MKSNFRPLVAATSLTGICCPVLQAAVKPYVSDANTVYLYHLDEAAGATSAASTGTTTFNAIAYDGNPANNNATTAQATNATLLGAAALSGFGNSASISAADLGLGVDANASGGFQMGLDGGATPDANAHSTLGASFTLEALVKFNGTTGNREIFCTDNSLANASRGFQFRVTGTNLTDQKLEFNFIGSNTATSTVAIPSTGINAYAINTWYHVALTYNPTGTVSTFYWTKVDPSNTIANAIGTSATETVTGTITSPLVFGNEARSAGSGLNSAEGLLGFIDEIRISNVVRAPGAFLFYNDDSDGDGLSDAWEIQYFTTITAQDGSGDPDGDGFTNEAEETAGTRPDSATFTPNDTDGDGLPDAWEITHFTNIAAQDGSGDPDADYATNAQEYAATTSPISRTSAPDADADGMGDAWEIHYFSDTSRLPEDDADSDGDSNLTEFTANSHPNDSAWSSTRAKLAHRWSFNNSLNDSVGGSNATVVDPDNDALTGGAATLSATDILLGGGAPATSSFVQLGSGLLQGGKTPVTLELWATQVSVQNWSRIFDFGSSTNEYLTIAWTQGANAATDMVEFKDAVANTSFNTNQPFTAGTEYHIVMTLEPGAGTGGTTRVTWYTKAVGTADIGAARGTFDTANTLELLTDTVDALGHSEYAADNTANARYNEFRIWNGALTFSERESYHDAGANNVDLSDVDGDGLPDAWEITHFGNTTSQTGDDDPDGDLYPNFSEFNDATDPNNIFSSFDSDSDGLADGYEVHWFRATAEETLYDIIAKYAGTSDPDGDGFTNIEERNTITGAPAPDPGTNPNSATFTPADIDGDGLFDAWEILHFTTITAQNGSGDPDTDGSLNSVEQAAGSNPTLAASTPTDTDGDAIPDSAEILQPYTADSHTLHLWHLDEIAAPAADAGSAPLSLASLQNGGILWSPTLGAFHTGLSTAAAANSRLGAFPEAADTTDNTITPYTGADGAFTLEALVQIGFNPVATANATTLQILSAEGDVDAERQFQFRVRYNAANVPTLEFINLHGAVGVQTVGLPIPLTGPHAIAQGSWYHVAVAYNGAENTAGNIKLFWTLLDPATGQANEITLGTENLAADLISPATGSDLVIGNEGRSTGGTTDRFLGLIDEVRVSDIARSANGFLFVSANPDLDGDGMDDAWETTHFGNTSQTATADPDGDGTDNLTEYRLGLDPNSGSSSFAATRSTAGLLTWPSATGLTFTVKRSTSLDAGSWSTIGTVPGTAGTASFTDPSPPAGGKAFYQILLEP